MKFMEYIEKLFDSKLPTDEKMRLITERFGGTMQYIPQDYVCKDAIYQQYQAISKENRKMEAYKIVSDVFGLSVNTIRKIVRERCQDKKHR